MYKKDFIHYLAQRLSIDLRDDLGDSVSHATASAVLESVLSAIVSVVSTGDEVKVHPLGRFYPKLIRRKGRPPNVKLGFTTYPKLDEWLTRTLSQKIEKVLGK